MARFEPVGDGHSIIVGGQRFPVGGGTRVVLWNEMCDYPRSYFRNPRAFPSLNLYATADPFGGRPVPRLYDAGGRGYIVNRRVTLAGVGDGGDFDLTTVEWDDPLPEPVLRHLRGIRQVVLHHDVARSSLSCHSSFFGSGLSVHFMLDADGTIYQACDLAHVTWHAGDVNDIAIGVEINQPAYWYTPCVVGTPDDPARQVGGVPTPAPAAPAGAGAETTFLNDLVRLGARRVALPGDRTHYQIACRRSHDGFGAWPVPIVFDGFVEGPQYSWGVVGGKAAAVAWKTGGRVGAGPAMTPHTDRHVQPTYTAAQAMAIRALAHALTSCPLMSISRAVLGDADHWESRLTLPALTLRDYVRERRAFSGVLSHAAVDALGKWDPGPSFPWDGVHGVFAGAGGGGLPPGPDFLTGAPGSWFATELTSLVSKDAGADVLASARGVQARRGDGNDERVRQERLDGALESLNYVAAAQMRLKVLFGLGYLDVDVGDVSGHQGDGLRDALRAFQSKEALPASGKLDGATRARLREVWAREVRAFHDARGRGSPGATG
ncbi:MAG TPA: peptidoglycan recognition family protein [Myxococcota bacterium]|jgi:hypothetical protein|nr:peptidoglycan recognition family protein [Myxococcota bacterium]